MRCAYSAGIAETPANRVEELFDAYARVSAVLHGTPAFGTYLGALYHVELIEQPDESLVGFRVLNDNAAPGADAHDNRRTGSAQFVELFVGEPETFCHGRILGVFAPMVEGTPA